MKKKTTSKEWNEFFKKLNSGKEARLGDTDWLIEVLGWKKDAGRRK